MSDSARAKNLELIQSAAADLSAGATGPDVAAMILQKDAFEAKERKRLIRLLGNRNCHIGQEDFGGDGNGEGEWKDGQFIRKGNCL
jgi:hypothetical protein